MKRPAYLITLLLALAPFLPAIAAAATA